MKPLHVCLLFLVLVLGLAMGPLLSQTREKAVAPTVAELPASEKPAAPTAGDLSALVAGNNEFAFDLYHQLAQKPGNKFFSPYSISTALAMTYAGARGNTAKEMAQTLHFTLDNERLHPAFGELLRKLNGTDKRRQFTLVTANSLWGDKTYLSPAPEFLRITREDYQAGFELVDFVGNTEGARRHINGWVEERSNKKIEKLVPKGILASDTRLVLANAIYFKAVWAVPFTKETTKPGDFTTADGRTVKVPMMKEEFKTQYMENEDFQLAELMYLNHELSMVVILPKKKDSLSEVEKSLSAKIVEQALAKARRKNLQVALPKFKMTEECRLTDQLEQMGIKDAFRPGIANFSGVERGSGSMLFISEVIHKAFVDVNEDGTEATAATSVVVSDVSEPPPPVSFHTDHPFFSWYATMQAEPSSSWGESLIQERSRRYGMKTVILIHYRFVLKGMGHGLADQFAIQFSKYDAKEISSSLPSKIRAITSGNA
jgi:serpin B